MTLAVSMAAAASIGSAAGPPDIPAGSPEGAARPVGAVTSASSAAAITAVTPPAAPAVPDLAVPDPTVPDPTVPDPTVPDPTVPDPTAPGPAIPPFTFPGFTFPGFTFPDLPFPDLAVPEFVVPDLTMPDLGFGDLAGAGRPGAGTVAGTPDLPFVSTTAAPGSAARVAIEFALGQRGLPYVWGGNGPRAGDAGFDCSGLTHAAYAAAGIALPRTAHTQYYAGPRLPAGADLQPGDLVFYGVPARVHHVGLYLGDGRMVNAPTFGKPVQVAYVRYPGDRYLGATRPSANRGADVLTVPDLPAAAPEVPATTLPPVPVEFDAPPAPDVDLDTGRPGTVADEPRPGATEDVGTAGDGNEPAAAPAPISTSNPARERDARPVGTPEP